MTIIHLVSNRVWGGGERYALDLALASCTEGDTVVIAGRKGCDAALCPFRDAGLEVRELPMSLPGRLMARMQLKELVKKVAGPVVIHTHNFKDAAMAAGIPGCKLVVSRQLVRPGKPSQDKLYAKISAIIFPSEKVKEAFLSSGVRVDETKLHVLPISLRQTPPPTELTTPNPGSPLRLLYAGRLHPEKGIETLFEAMRRVGNTHLTVCGTGEEGYLQALKQKAQGLDVEWSGHVADIFPFLAQCHVLVAPSIVPEAFGLTLLEAMAAARPVIASCNGAQPEIIDHGNEGLLTTPGDPDDLAWALAEIRPRLSWMGQKAHETFEQKYNFDSYYAKIKGIYSQR